MAKDVDKLAAQYAVSINEAKNVISSWLGDSDNEKEEESQVDFKPLQASKGLGAVQENESYRPRVMDNSYRALNSLKKRKEREDKATKTSHKVPKKPTKDSDSDEEESRSGISKKASNSSASAFDMYRKKKR
ncbi:hypothetical protein TRICI_005292 [Trichomonascus ciferrii]|uniref:Uncharacterized protein n=1 Tax=Trichomonascus ciferrii TaxID=44093 RepID=A0A642UUH0_9ASCO|nr:hypothetical protein TRICI_005292 [Trichomonascus ciferrii]